MDSMNVALRLTDNEKKLAVLRERGALKADENGIETYQVMFDARPYSFTAGKIIHVPQSVGECLRDLKPLMGGSPTKRKNAMGDEYTFRSSYDATFTDVLDIVEKWNAGDEPPSLKRAKATMCHVCEPARDFGTVAKLREHLLEHE